MKKGVSLISLIITVIVIIILAGITVFSSLNTVEQSQVVKNEAEFKDVCTLVRSISTRAEAELITLSLTNATLATEEQLSSFYTTGEDSEFTSEEQNNIFSYNQSGRAPQFGYHYVTGKQIENDAIPGMEGFLSSTGSFTVPSKVNNDYIINFYYGTVIAKVSPDKTLISGRVQ